MRRYIFILAVMFIGFALPAKAFYTPLPDSSESYLAETQEPQDDTFNEVIVTIAGTEYIIEDIVPAGYAADGDCLDIVVCIDLETHTRVSYIAKSPLGLCGENSEGYFSQSWNQLIYGNLTEDVTALGTAAQIITGLINLDLPGDVRDISADMGGWKWTWGHAGQTGLDIIGLLPVIGAAKYADEAGDLLKSGRKARHLRSINKVARKQVDSVAREFGISGVQRKKLGKYIEKMKRRGGQGGADNFSYDELRSLTREFLDNEGY